MKLLLIFNKKEIEIKEGGKKLFKGGSHKAFKELKTIHEKFLEDNCINSTEALLHNCFQSVIEEIQVKDRQKKDIILDLLELLDDGNIVEDSIETDVPCVTIVQEKDPSETSFHYIAISKDEKTIFKIMLQVSDGKIDIYIGKGSIAYK